MRWSYIVVAQLIDLIVGLTANRDFVKTTCDGVSKVNATFLSAYKYNVSEDNEIIFDFESSFLPNQSTSVRVHVSSDDAVNTYPVFVVVRQQRNILSWQIPLTMHNAFEYYETSRTLCRYDNDNTSVNWTSHIVLSIDVSTASSTPVPFTLSTGFVEDYLLSLNYEIEHKITPSEPQYFKFVFPDSIKSVTVKAFSKDQTCMVFSIQDIHCPVFDLDMNVEFTGQYQTMTKKAAITVQKSKYPNHSFYIVLVLKPNDYQCTGIEQIMQPAKVAGGTFIPRQKMVSVHVEPAITKVDYIKGTLAAIGFFLGFYLVAGLLLLLYHKFGMKEEEYLDNSETDHVQPTAQPMSYGTTRSQAVVALGGGPSTNSAGHVTDDSSQDDEDDYDTLEDIDQEKDIYRTKTNLFVSDLSKKKVITLAKKYKLYHKNLLTISIFYGLPVVQLVVTYQKVLNITGNEDICYYNFFCAHPLGVLSAFNNVYSNIGYVLLGILFLCLTLRRDWLHKKSLKCNEAKVQSCGIPQHFGLFYAMGLALVMEGIMSGCYHVCPTYSNFQFDTAFMYVIAGLCMLKIYSIRHPDINATANSSYLALALIILLAVLGVVYGRVWFWILFTLVHIACVYALSLEIYFMGRWKLDGNVFKRVWFVIKTDVMQCAAPTHKMRFALLLCGNIINWAIAIFGVVSQPKDFASYLLAIFIANLLLYMTFYISMKIYFKERILPVPVFFILMDIITWAGALYFFIFKAHTNWEKMPAQSREENDNCIVLNFYDAHDVWHFLSALGLFMSFLIMMILDDDLIKIPRSKIRVF